MNQQAQLYKVNDELGLNLRGGQQTTRILYDTETLDITAGTVEFFENFANKTLTETNLNDGKLPSGESMVIKEISFFVNSIEPPKFEANSVLNIFVGNLRVIKDLPLSHFSSNVLNPSPLGIQVQGKPYIRLLTNIVIPPQVAFRATLKVAANILQSPFPITIFMKGTGVLFNPSTSL